MFWGQVFHWCICQLHPTLSLPTNSKTVNGYRKYSYKFATENDIKVISAAAAMCYGTPDPLPPVSALSDFGEQHQVQIGSRNSIPNRKY